MKKIFLLVLSVLVLTGGNYQMVDMNYTFDYAECYLNGEFHRYDIDSWTDYDGEQVQIKAKDGNTYLLSMNYCRLVKE